MIVAPLLNVTQSQLLEEKRNISICYAVICLTLSMWIAGSSSDDVPEKQRLVPDQRAELTSQEFCQKLPFYIPAICYGIRSGINWMFRSPAASWIFSLCNLIVNQQTGSTRRKRKAAEDITKEIQVSHSLKRTRSNSISETAPKSAAASDGELHDITDEEKNPSFNITSPSVCMKIVERIGGMCQFFLGHTIANGMRNFGWLCFFSYPTMDSRMKCYAMVKGLTRLCRVQMTNQTELDELNDVNQTKPVFDPSKKSATAMPLMTPIKTCKSLAPTFSTLCLVLPLVMSIYGAVLGNAMTMACMAVTDGLKYVIPHKWSSSSQSKQAIPGDLLVDGNDDSVGWLKDGISVSGNNSSIVFHDNSTHNNRDGKGTQVGHKKTDEEEEVGDGTSWWSPLKDAWKSFKGDTNYAALYACTQFMKVASPVCKSLGAGAGYMDQLAWVCAAGQGLAGACVYLVRSFSAICQGNLKCQMPNVPSNFTCVGRKDGFYTDSSYPCASYYISCYSGVRAVMQCNKGQDYVFEESKQKCTKRLKIEACHDKPVPCAPETDTESANQNQNRKRFPKLTCDPSLPVPKNSSSGKIIDSIKDLFHRNRKRSTGLKDMLHHSPFHKHKKGGDGTQKIEGGQDKGTSKADVSPSNKAVLTRDSSEFPFSNSNCTGKKKKVLFFADPTESCSTLYYMCENEQLLQRECDELYQVFSAKKKKCVARRKLDQCQLPACSGDDPLRQDCDPRLPMAPVGYDPTTFIFDCSGKGYGVYSNPYERCSEHFYICGGISGSTGKTGIKTDFVAAEKMSCNALPDDPDTYVFDDQRKICIPREDDPDCNNPKPACRSST